MFILFSSSFTVFFFFFFSFFATLWEDLKMFQFVVTFVSLGVFSHLSFTLSYIAMSELESVVFSSSFICVKQSKTHSHFLSLSLLLSFSSKRSNVSRDINVVERNFRALSDWRREKLQTQYTNVKGKCLRKKWRKGEEDWNKTKAMLQDQQNV